MWYKVGRFSLLLNTLKKYLPEPTNQEGWRLIIEGDGVTGFPCKRDVVYQPGLGKKKP